MSKTLVSPIIGLIVGLLLGAAATYFYMPKETVERFGSPVERDTEYVPVISMAEAEVHREDSFSSIETIEGVFALPTEFAQTEALYVMAGREDTFGIHELLNQAFSINSMTDRNMAINILLVRLTELDPYEALETSRRSPLAGNPTFERSVWKAWARLDMEQALAVAQDGTRLERNNAAQSLYSSVRDFDAAQFAMIESTLGIEPDRDTRARRIYALAADSSAAAIALIESLPSTTERREQMTFFAYYLSKLDPRQQQQYAELVRNPADRDILERTLASYSATADPETALANYEQEPGNSRYQMHALNALKSLSRQDPDAAIGYVENMTDQRIRQRLISVVAQGVAANDPERAISWASELSSSGERNSAMAAVVGQIAQTDPQMAISQARLITAPAARNRALQSAIAVASHSDPAGSVELLSYVTDQDTRHALVGQLAQTWGKQDFDAAVQWMATLGVEEKRVAVQGMAQRFARHDVDRAIALDQQFPDATSPSLRSQIAQNLAQQRSIEAAQSYIAQYKGTSEFPRLQASAIASVARTDPDMAMQMVDSIEEPKYRDQLITSVIAQKAKDDPRVAMQWAENITDPEARQNSLGQVAAVWNRNDPDQAQAWLQGLPRGGTRDSTIVAVTAGHTRVGPETLNLINTIDDKSKRKHAMMMYVQRMAFSQPAEAERVLATMDLTDTERRQFERFFDGTYYNSGMHID